MTNLCRMNVELCRMNVGFMSNEVHIKKAQPADIHIVSRHPMSNVEQNRKKKKIFETHKFLGNYFHNMRYYAPKRFFSLY